MGESSGEEPIEYLAKRVAESQGPTDSVQRQWVIEAIHAAWDERASAEKVNNTTTEKAIYERACEIYQYLRRSALLRDQRLQLLGRLNKLCRPSSQQMPWLDASFEAIVEGCAWQAHTNDDELVSAAVMQTWVAYHNECESRGVTPPPLKTHPLYHEIIKKRQGLLNSILQGSRDLAEAEDALAEALSKMVRRHMTAPEQLGTLKLGWIVTVARNDFRRRLAQRKREVATDPQDLASVVDLRNPGQKREEELDEVLARHPEIDERVVRWLILCRNGVSFEDIAHRYGCEPLEVYVRIKLVCRARNEIAAELENELDGPEPSVRIKWWRSWLARYFAIEGLNDRDLTLVAARLDGESYMQISDIDGRTVGTLRVRMTELRNVRPWIRELEQPDPDEVLGDQAPPRDV